LPVVSCQKNGQGHQFLYSLPLYIVRNLCSKHTALSCAKIMHIIRARFLTQQLASGKQITTCRLVLHESLVEHGVGDLHETSDVGAYYEIARLPIFFGCLICLLMNSNHNVVQSLVDLFASP